MEPIYVTGHRNPDTDSIVSAMAYAALRNALGDREFVPARLGHISDETRLVLGRFGSEPPIRIQTMRTQVRDLDYDTPPALSGAVTVSRAWTALQNNRSIPAIPVTNDNGELYGMLSPSEIASYDMRTLSDSRVDRIPVFNLLSVLDGKIINEDGYLADTISGEVSIALPQDNENLLFRGPDAIVIIGEQPEMARRALEQQVSCLIVCQAELPEELQESAAQPETESPQEPMKGLGALMSQPLGALLQSAGKLEQKQEALLNALRPFLKPNRREKLDRAIRAARLSQLAGRALKSRNENDLP